MATAAPLLKVRTVTVGITLDRGKQSEWPAQIEAACAFNKAAADAYTAAGFEVQTTRISTNSFEEYVDCSDREAALATFREIDAVLQRLEINLFNAGPARTDAGVSLVPDVIRMSPRISASGSMPTPYDAAAARRLAECVLRIAAETDGGEGNFQFAASFN
eukprot:6209143-Prymnesium_polylepis.1